MQPDIDTSGTLTFEVNKDLNGIAKVYVQLYDNGGTDNNGVDITAVHTLTISVLEVNDAPVFTGGSDINTTVGADFQEYPNWATSIILGPEDESDQTNNFIVRAFNYSLFDVQPYIDVEGNLTFEPNKNYAGTTIVSVQLFDSGGAERGGINSSYIDTFIITVNPVDDIPTIYNNEVLHANNGSSSTITSGHLSAIDYEIENGSIMYSITAPPVNGKIIKDDNPGTTVTSFKQQDIYDGRIKYLHDGSYTFQDSLLFSVSDSKNVLTDQLFYIVVNTTVSVEDQENVELNIWPNPVSDKLFVQSSQLISQIDVYNITGNLILNTLPESNSSSIDLSMLNQGLYIIKIRSEKGSYVRKIIKN
jgi:hypothetical protein